ncbi:hypothetical protein LUZ60_015339 [Juncus effusus]|nr:hypothetical protein LUZ60_015339 [Juncus effusus]
MTQDAEKTIVAKPVATRLFSNSRPVSFFDPSNVVKPKTIRFKPKENKNSPSDIITSKDDMSDSIGEGSNTSILYKPTPKLVSRKSISHLPNLENMSPNKPASSSQNLGLDHSNNHLIQTLPITNYYPNPTSQLSDPSSFIPQNTEQQTQEMSHQTANSGSADRPSYDGYNWRKYGQKQVKGSEFPRSYYKCTHPNCPVKKKVERTLEGQIAEIVYKGEHNHSKPQPPKRPQQTVRLEGNIASNNNNNCFFDGNFVEARMESHSEFGSPGLSSSYQGHNGNFTRVSESVCITSSGNTDGPNNKRRKKDDKISGEISVPGAEKPGNIMMETDITGDGFQWRKYGQKVVKGNSYPRSYYRCTSPKCNVRKYVERVSDDFGSFVTTYEGKHNHEAPSRRTSSDIS